MGSRNAQTVLCPLCFQGRISATLRMAKHAVTPWVPCLGAGQDGFLPEEVEEHGFQILYGLVETPDGVAGMWRWACVCLQRGAWRPQEWMAEQVGSQHVTVKAKKRRSGS